MRHLELTFDLRATLFSAAIEFLYAYMLGRYFRWRFGLEDRVSLRNSWVIAAGATLFWMAFIVIIGTPQSIPPSLASGELVCWLVMGAIVPMVVPIVIRAECDLSGRKKQEVHVLEEPVLDELGVYTTELLPENVYDTTS